MTGKSVEWEGPIDQACTLGRSARCPAWRTVWAGRLELLPKVRAWSIGPPQPTLLPVTALWPNTVFGALAQLEGGKRGLLTQHFFWSNSPTGHQIEEALFFRVSFLPPYRETRLPNGCSRYPRDGKIYVNLFFTAAQLCLGWRQIESETWDWEVEGLIMSELGAAHHRALPRPPPHWDFDHPSFSDKDFDQKFRKILSFEL